MIPLDELKKQRFQYVHTLYELAGAASGKYSSIFDIQEKIGILDNDNFLNVDSYLIDEGLIEVNRVHWHDFQKALKEDPSLAKRLATFELSVRDLPWCVTRDREFKQFSGYSLEDKLGGIKFREDFKELNDEQPIYQDSEEQWRIWRYKTYVEVFVPMLRALTHKGLKEVEQALSKPEIPTEHFPANVSYTINVAGDMVGTAFIGTPMSDKKQEKVRMLFVSANPGDTHPLELIKECNNVRDRLISTEYGDQLDFDQRHEISVSELDKILLDYKPQLLHFSGHGTSEGIIIFEDSGRQSEGASIKALSDLFGIVNSDRSVSEKNRIKLVFLNACYSEKQAKAISQYVDCVVGMSTSVTDDAARIFAESFYQAIGYGKSIKTAFDLGCNKVSRLNIPEEHTPKLLHRPQLDPSTIYLIRRDE